MNKLTSLLILFYLYQFLLSGLSYSRQISELEAILVESNSTIHTSSSTFESYCFINRNSEMISCFNSCESKNLSFNSLEVDSLIPINIISLIKTNAKTLDKFFLERSNFFLPIHLINYETNSFLLDLGLPSNFYELSLLQLNNRSNSFYINERQINDPLTNLVDLRDLRFDEFASIEIIFPTRSFLLSRNNDENSIILNEWKRYSFIPFSKIHYIEAPYDNLFFDGLFNVNFSKELNFEFGVTKHNALGRFTNTEKDLWAGKLKLVYFFSNSLNFELVYRYSKSLVRFNEGININNPFLSQGESIDNVLYDNQRAISINNDAYHKWTMNSIDLNGLLQVDKISQSQINFYFQQSLREFRDNEHKADSIRVFDNHWSRVIGMSIKENLQLPFNRFEFKATYERVIIESPFVFSKVIDDLFSTSGIYQIEFFDFIIPSFYLKLNKFKGSNRNLFSYGSDFTFNLSKKINFVLGVSKFQKIYSYDERYFYNFNLNDFISNVFLTSGRLNYSSIGFNFASEIYFRKEFNSVKQTEFYSIEQNNSILNTPFENFTAFGIKSDLTFSFWRLKSKFGISYNDNLVKIGNSNYHKLIYPRYQGQFEIFYRDILFKSSLDLMAGFRIKVFSSFVARSFSPAKLSFVDIRTYNDSLLNFSSISIPANFTIDLIASGRVKDAAIVYFSIENLLDKKFYLLPYYPVNDIQLRFGINWEFYD